MLRRLVLSLAIVPAALLAACGSSGSGGDADPATVAPRGVPFYLEVTLRPEGATRDDALAAAAKVLHTDDPEGRIRSLIGQAFASGDTKVDFAKDIEPWLGSRAGMWFTMPARSGAGPGGAAAVAVTDADLAREKVDELAKRNGEKLASRSSGGHDYEVSSDGTAVAVEGDWVLIGTEGEVRRGLATLDGDGLTSEDRYRKAIEPLPSDRLAHYFLDLKSMVDAALRADPQTSEQLGMFQGAVTSALAGSPQAGAFTADGDRLALETVMRGDGGVGAKLYALTGLAASPLLTEFPGDAWGALAVPKVGESLRTVFNQLGGAFGGAAAAQQLRRDYGIDLEQDVFSWIGDAGAFVRGTRVDGVDGALVIQATDEAKATSAFGKLVGLLRTKGGLDPRPAKVAGADAAFSVAMPDAPKPLVLARGNGRVVAGFGADAAAGGLSAPSALGDSDTYAQASDALGGKIDPAVLASLPQILALVESSGATASDPDYAKAKPYLDAFGVIAAGSEREGDTLRSRLAVGLK
jgi:hypothetical protein